MNPRIKLMPSHERALLRDIQLWQCEGGGSMGCGETPRDAYIAWYRARVKAITR